MGVDGIEFQPGYHQNVGPYQEVWFDLVKSYFENTIGNPFFLTSGS